jgi:hypothetical protein
VRTRNNNRAARRRTLRAWRLARRARSSCTPSVAHASARPTGGTGGGSGCNVRTSKHSRAARHETGPSTHDSRTFQVATEPQTMWEVAELVIPCPPRLLLPIYTAPGAMREELSRAPAWTFHPPSTRRSAVEDKYTQAPGGVSTALAHRVLFTYYTNMVRRGYARASKRSARVSTHLGSAQRRRARQNMMYSVCIDLYRVDHLESARGRLIR